MDYPKKVMRKNELKKMGFPEEYLMKVYRSRNQKIAWKMDLSKKNSPILFDTEAFEKYRQKEMQTEAQSRRYGCMVM